MYVSKYATGFSLCVLALIVRKQKEQTKYICSICIMNKLYQNINNVHNGLSLLRRSMNLQAYT